MHSDLITAVRERQELGYSKDKIRDELRAAGHDEEVIEQIMQSEQTGFEEQKNVQITSISDLLTESFSFIKKRIDLLLALLAPVALITVLGYISSVLPTDQQESADIIVGLVSLFSLIFYVLLLVAALYIVMQKQEREITIRESLVWSRKNIWGVFWIYILIMLVVWGGLILFIIPGIILWVAVHFSQFVYVHEGLKGMSALRRSHDLVKGNWIALAKPLSLVGILMLIVFIVLGVTSGLAESFSGGNDFVVMISVLILDVFSTAATIVSFVVGARLYKDISAKRGESESDKNITGKWKYIFIIGIGILAMVATGIAVSGLEDYDEELIDGSETTSLEAKARAIELRIQDSP